MAAASRFASRLRAGIAAGATLLLASPALAQGVKWDTIPTMQLERLYRGPLRDTIVQRWRDPADGTVCYMFIPINAPHTPPNDTGYVQYGPNTIGSISCVATGRGPPVAQGKEPAAEAPAQPAAAKQGGRVASKAAAPAARARPTTEKPVLATPPASEPLPEPKLPTPE